MTTKKDTTGTNLADNAPAGLTVTDAEAEKARHEGALDAVKDAAKDARISLTDGAQPGDPAVDRWPGSDESQQYAYMLEDAPDAFDKRVNGKDSPVTDVMAAGLLKLERAGQNRTPYVKTLLKRLGLKGSEIGEVTSAGPAYTNDMSLISGL
ncbi:hypothetical protein [Sphingomonas sp. R86520]|uniref:hypothetical protein n=1 Tax=Sphingomonas sp. R86520 TaxID=3093859 RepID=UPI0036D29B37